MKIKLGTLLGLFILLALPQTVCAQGFQPYIYYDVGSRPEAVAIGDVNGDGKNDVVMTTSTQNDPENDNTVFVFLQNSDGILNSPVKYLSDGTPTSVSIGDMNNDGKKDVVVGNRDNIEVFLQNQSGGLDSGVIYNTTNSISIKTGDFNNDGLIDIAGIGAGPGTVDILLQESDGLLGSPITYSVINTNLFNSELEAGDVNNDGLTDLIVMMRGDQFPNIGVLYQQANVFSSPAYYRVDENITTYGVAVGDINNDKLNDIIVSYGGNQPTAFIGSFNQNTDGTLDPAVSYKALDIPESIVTADVDADGRMDILVLNGGGYGLSVYPQDPSGLFSYSRYHLPEGLPYNPQGLAVGDLNSDGTVDVAIADKSNGLVILYNGGESGDCNLKGLSPSSGGLTPAFSPDTTYYTMWQEPIENSITVTPTVHESHAIVTINGKTVASGTASQNLNVGPGGLNVGIPIKVKAQNGFEKLYLISASRRLIGDVATLCGLNTSAGNLNPVFDTDTFTYALRVPYSTNSISLTPTVSDCHATVMVNGVTVASGTASSAISLNPGVAKTIYVMVRAENGTTTMTYKVTVTRATSSSSTDARLRSLKPSTGTLNPTFASGTEGYSINVDNSVSSIRLTPTVNESNATVTVNGVRVTSGSASAAISLEAGVPKIITVVVTAQDLATTKTYTVTVTHDSGIISSDATLNRLWPNVGSLNPAFNADTLDYTVGTIFTVDHIGFAPFVAESHATVKVNGVSVNSGEISGPISLMAGVPQTILVVVTAQDGTTTRSYSVTVTRAISSDATLSGLVPSSGIMNPSFAPGRLAYNLNVGSSVNSITLTPTVDESHATVTVNGVSVISGSPSEAISLEAGVPRTINVVVTAADMITTRTYTVTVGISSDATLSGLVPSAGSLDPSFTRDTLNYAVSVDYAVGSIMLTPTVNESHASIKVNGTAVLSGNSSGAISLVIGVPKAIPVVITAHDGTTTKTYTVTVTRSAPSQDASLSGLTATSGLLNPTFAAGTLSYTLKVPYATSSIRFTPTVNESHASVKVNGSTVSSGSTSGSISLTAGVAKTISIVVTAQDGTTKTYKVSATRATSSMSTDARLRSLRPSTGSINPVFAAGTLGYSVNLDNSVSSIMLTPTAYESHAKVKVDGVSVNSGYASPAINVEAGVPKPILVVVTAQDLATTKTYTVTVTRANGEISSDSTLSGLASSAGSLNPSFNANTQTYTVSVANGVSSITLTPTVNESHATVTVDGISVVSGTPSGAKTLVVGEPRIITVVVTAQDRTTRTYTVTVTRADVTVSSDATLQGLTASAGSLNPSFNANTQTYTVSVANGVSSITLTPTVNESHATVTVDGISVVSGTPSGAKTLVVGEPRIITVVVTAQDSTTRTYTVTVTRADVTVSSDATLKGLTTNLGSLTPSFSPTTLTYTKAVSHYSSIRVIPTANESHATIKVNGVTVVSGTSSNSISLSERETNTILVVVTAQDGITTKTYKITFS